MQRATDSGRAEQAQSVESGRRVAPGDARRGGAASVLRVAGKKREMAQDQQQRAGSDCEDRTPEQESSDKAEAQRRRPEIWASTRVLAIRAARRPTGPRLLLWPLWRLFLPFGAPSPCSTRPS
ncbi:hypothetical protein COCVIDRAFT_13039 [Bipolaris victoriae FI3]|uniref:Uncharacterized protein n=1 Tax=Bipolaris victoriae (strain FI3) TaxID=930091 RepID=W7EXN3_BIPV3|nr:hypothetical protein COCVIDRAFT_13039 [Bipolaris victoriae FI3]